MFLIFSDTRSDCEFKFWCGIEALKNFKNDNQIQHILGSLYNMDWAAFKQHGDNWVPFINYYWTLIQFL